MREEVSAARANAQGHFERAQQHAQKGRWERAIEAARLALEADPEWAEVRHWLVDVYTQQGDKRRAVHQLEQLLLQHPKDEGVLQKMEALDPMTAARHRRLADIAPDPFVSQASRAEFGDMDAIYEVAGPPALGGAGLPGVGALTGVEDTLLVEPGEEEMVTAPPSLPVEMYAYEEEPRLREALQAQPATARALERQRALWAGTGALAELLGRCRPLDALAHTDFAGAVAYAAQTLGLGVPNVHTIEDEGLSPIVAGADMSHLIVPTGLLQAVGPSELYFVVGHRLAHIAAGHNPLLELSVAYLPRPRPGQFLEGWLYDALKAGLGEAGELGAQPEVAGLLRALHAWSLRAELTVDRGALVCCQNADDACRAIARLTCATAAQASALTLVQFMTRFAGQDVSKLAALGAEQSPGSHEAYAFYRIAVLSWWAGQDAYRHCLRHIGMV